MPLVRRVYSRDWFRGYQTNIDVMNIGIGPYANETEQISKCAWSQPDGSLIDNGSGYTGYRVNSDDYYLTSLAPILPGQPECLILKHGLPIRQEESYCVDWMGSACITVNDTPAGGVYGPGVLFTIEYLDSALNEPGDSFLAVLNCDNTLADLYLNFYEHVYVAPNWTWVYVGQVKVSELGAWVDETRDGRPFTSFSIRIIHNYSTPKMPGGSFFESKQDGLEIWYYHGKDMNAVQFVSELTPTIAERSDLDIMGVACHMDTVGLGLRHGEPRYYCGLYFDEVSSDTNASIYHVSQSSYWDYTVRGEVLLERIAPVYSGNGFLYVTPGDMWGSPVFRSADEIETWVQENRIGRRLGKSESETDNPYLTLYHSGRLGKVDHTASKGDYDAIIVRDGYSRFRSLVGSAIGNGSFDEYAAGDYIEELFLTPMREQIFSDWVAQPGGKWEYWKWDSFSMATGRRANDWTPIVGDRTYKGATLWDLGQRAAYESGSYLYYHAEGQMLLSSEPRDMSSILISSIDPVTGEGESSYLGAKQVDGGFTYYNFIQVLGKQSGATKVYGEAKDTTSIDKDGVRSLDPPYYDPNIATNAEANAIAQKILDTYSPQDLTGVLSELMGYDIYSIGWADIRPADLVSVVLPEYAMGIGPSKSGNASDWVPLTMFVTERALQWEPDNLFYIRHRCINNGSFLRVFDTQAPEEYQMIDVKKQSFAQHVDMISAW